MALKCESKHGCDDTAQWWAVHVCCGWTDALCGIDARLEKEWIGRYESTGLIRCDPCKREGLRSPDVMWELI